MISGVPALDHFTIRYVQKVFMYLIFCTDAHRTPPPIFLVYHLHIKRNDFSHLLFLFFFTLSFPLHSILFGTIHICKCLIIPRKQSVLLATTTSVQEERATVWSTEGTLKLVGVLIAVA